MNSASQVNNMGLFGVCKTSIEIFKLGSGYVYFLKEHISEKSVKDRLERGVSGGYCKSRQEVMRHETMAVEVGVRELTDGRNITELISMEIYGGVGER